MKNTTEREFEHCGLLCRVILTHMGHRNGYVRLPEGHPLFGKNYSDDVVCPKPLREVTKGKVGPIPWLCAAMRFDVLESAGLIPVDILFDVHGGITYADDWDEKDQWWFGFDCCHSGDDPSVQDTEYVAAECKSLAEQLDAYQKAVTP